MEDNFHRRVVDMTFGIEGKPSAGSDDGRSDPQRTHTVERSHEEGERLAALKRYDVLDTPPEQAFDRITRLVAHLQEAPIALVSLVDEDRLWFKSYVGVDFRELERQGSFCLQTIQSEGVTVIPDAPADKRFVENQLVAGDAGISFYAGAPLVTPDGYRIGTLCALDTESRSDLGTEERERLKDLAALVVDELELRREIEVRKRREEDLETARREVKKANEVMSRFFAGVAHDLRTPLTSILMYADLLRKALGTGEEKISRYIDRIRQAGERMRSMTGLLVDLVQVRSGGLSFEMSRGRVWPVVTEACGAVEEQLEEDTRSIDVTAEDKSLRASMAPMAMRRVLDNLLENALQYTDSEVEVHVRRARQGEADDLQQEAVVVEVRDFGPGIEPDRMETLFEPFAQQDRKSEGMGLGLAIASDLTEAMGGILEASSEVGEGTCFRVCLPSDIDRA